MENFLFIFINYNHRIIIILAYDFLLKTLKNRNALKTILLDYMLSNNIKNFTNQDKKIKCQMTSLSNISFYIYIFLEAILISSVFLVM